ncbi:hypothetical protein ACIGXA_10485 [Streptomyces fildesensis]|uniref:Chromosome partitioning protein n=1 Tax=Streptomyces fildesensis TaxID=375757 RepID=A0ABW8C691_9ACTN
MEIVVGYVFAWAVRKARRVGGRADAEVDQALDAGMERLHGLVARQLGSDASLVRVEEEALAGEELTPRTRQRLALALEDEMERDAVFAETLSRAVKEVRAAAGPGGVSAGDSGLAVGGNLDIRADHGSAAAVRMGDVHLGNPPVPGPPTQA